MSICTLEWWRKVVDAWNDSAGASSMSGFGQACFEVVDAEFPPAYVEWGDKGQAILMEMPDDTCVVFGATYDNWVRFVAGEFSAMEGAFTGRIKIKGNALAVLPYTGAFTRLAEVARTVPVEG